MKIAIASTYVPFINGGARFIVEWLATALEQKGHQVEVVYLPEIDRVETLTQQMMAFRWVDLDAADRVICFRPQAHLIRHRHKIVWFIHHIRAFYDLWHTPYCGILHDESTDAFRNTLHTIDNAALGEAKYVFTNSKIVAQRLAKYNNVKAEVLYPPVFKPERFSCQGSSDEVVCICRMEHHKRQHILVEAMAYVTTNVKLRLLGVSSGDDYYVLLDTLIKSHGLLSKVVVDKRWISEEEKAQALSNCLAVAYVPLDEDSYGYPTLEAAHSQKPILTLTDAGGVLEFVIDDYNGYVSEPDPQAIAVKLDQLYRLKEHTKKMGGNAHRQISDLKISWGHVLDRLLS